MNNDDAKSIIQGYLAFLEKEIRDYEKASEAAAGGLHLTEAQESHRNMMEGSCRALKTAKGEFELRFHEYLKD